MNRLLNLKQIKQKSSQWYKIRNEIITATDVATILDCNKFESKRDLLENKINGNNNFSNNATEWGNYFEDIALNIYSKINNNIEIKELGLIKHHKIKWLGASPDGIIINNKLIEIKCPFSKRIFKTVPINYWIQTQIQMEVCNINETILFVCAFDKNKKNKKNKKNNCLFEGKKDGDYWSLINCKEFKIKRDKEWFKQNKLEIENFYNDMKYFKKNGIDLKRKNNLDHDINYKKKLKTEYKILKDWNNLNNLVNYFNNDTILDWLNLYGKKMYLKDKKSVSQIFIENKSKEFKKHVINFIKERFPDQYIEITNQPDNYVKSNNYYSKTIENIGKYPIIINGILHNYNYKIYSKVDLIISKEYYYLLSGKELTNSDYIIIKIEYNSLKFLKNEINVSSNIFLKNYMFILQDALKENNINSIGGVLGFKSNLNNNCFQSIGIVNADKYNLENALQWHENLKKNGHLWSINQPTIPELCPNLKNTNDFPWKKTKKIMAYQNNDLSILSGLTMKEKKTFHSQGILSLNQIDNTVYDSYILDINFNSNKLFLPEIINNNNSNWKNSKKEIYIDFETVNNLNKDYLNFPEHQNSNLIYMIGIGYNNRGIWNYYNFTVEKINKESELNMLIDFNNFLNTLEYDIIYHWSNAEINFLNNSNKRHNTNFKLNKNCDLLNIFKSEPIVIKDLFDYKLKNVVKIMNKHNYINIKWDDLTDGLDAMILAWKYNEIAIKNNISLNKIDKFKSIIKYNEVDCKSMYEIIKYLKNNHI